ncbi:MAG: bifunctional indole-3-glycerol-phosphate synthase TrpC/phosphoribosylanthranilate isomerase TrpF, partial [Gammaproteobacteria bacterium]|nr:bifunctional indole-3-glycerol-phosphate synthase TrpC/phosphoribosylanthranilate isomerase TrpF [Gammaproteobacteria bacterium]
VLDNDQYLMLASVASELNLDILTEVHNEEELLRALKLEANIIGINNRNLKDLSVDLSVTEKLVPLIPKDKIVIAESGISNHQDVLRLAPKVNGFLVGSSLMAENDIESRCKVLLFGQVKICGITRMEDAQAVHASGGSYLGFIFYPKSKRYIQPNEAKKIIDALPIKSVGVFVDEKPEDLIAIAQDLKLDVIQLHGDESDDDIKNIKAHLPDIKIWKAIHVDNPNDLENMDFDSSLIDRYLLDTYSTSEKGGTGKAFNWEWLNDLPMDKIILAGGINLDNIQQARRLKPFAIDLSSGVEICPGIKSSEKLTQLFKSLRA